MASRHPRPRRFTGFSLDRGAGWVICRHGRRAHGRARRADATGGTHTLPRPPPAYTSPYGWAPPPPPAAPDVVSQGPAEPRRNGPPPPRGRYGGRAGRSRGWRRLRTGPPPWRFRLRSAAPPVAATGSASSPGPSQGGTAPFGGQPFSGPGQQGGAPLNSDQRYAGQRRPAHRPGPDHHDPEVPGWPGRRHRG